MPILSYNTSFSQYSQGEVILETLEVDTRALFIFEAYSIMIKKYNRYSGIQKQEPIEKQIITDEGHTLTVQNITGKTTVLRTKFNPDNNTLTIPKDEGIKKIMTERVNI